MCRIKFAINDKLIDFILYLLLLILAIYLCSDSSLYFCLLIDKNCIMDRLKTLSNIFLPEKHTIYQAIKPHLKEGTLISLLKFTISIYILTKPENPKKLKPPLKKFIYWLRATLKGSIKYPLTHRSQTHKNTKIAFSSVSMAFPHLRMNSPSWICPEKFMKSFPMGFSLAKMKPFAKKTYSGVDSVLTLKKSIK